MPEQLTKHPDVTLQVLRSAGAECGTGAAKEILTACPSERFCKLPGGEICVYGLAEAPRMTQVTAADWQAVLGATSPSTAAGTIGDPLVIVGGTSLALGVLIGAALAKRLARHRGRH